MTDWLENALNESEKLTVCSQSSGNKTDWEQKVGTAESLIWQGFQEFVPTVPTVPTQKQHPPKNAANAPFMARSSPALPADLLSKVNLICRLERWTRQDREEWLLILHRQITEDRTPAHELTQCLALHLAVHHAADMAA
ncbi:hypothetical protein [Aquitalea sp. LB_tupeE]|uniref:hypothetical protein n=1 Tax=Aquitalea sp. LB_tupeE TaxID=2748078 RepID=UPI0015B9B65F|nr:hypothetical protein [Aquitalea sp. LB_tupeE]NWK79816.1 hypothetical protein [Aquitalea sp. LB_tupeE]